MNDLGKEIRRLRKERGLSQEDLVAKMQLRGHSTLSQPRQAEIEQGLRDISAAELVSYARVLGVPITRLLGELDFGTSPD